MSALLNFFDFLCQRYGNCCNRCRITETNSYRTIETNPLEVCILCGTFDPLEIEVCICYFWRILNFCFAGNLETKEVTQVDERVDVFESSAGDVALYDISIHLINS